MTEVDERFISKRMSERGLDGQRLIDSGQATSRSVRHGSNNRDVTGNSQSNRVGLPVATAQNATPVNQGISRAPSIVQGRLILSDFGVNEWALTAAHRRGLNQFIQLLLNTVTYEVLQIEGRASNTGPESEQDIPPQGQGPGNIELSRLRANAVVQYLFNRGIISAFTPQLIAHGSASPLILADGEVDINRSVTISYTYIPELPAPDPLPPLPIPDPIVSQSWAISLNFSVSAGAVIAGFVAVGKLKNLQTNETFRISFLVLGIGAGAATGSSGGPDSFESFSTRRAVPAIAFHRQYCRISNVGGGLVIGGGLTTIRIPELSDEEIRISGLSLGVVGADITGGIVGVMWFQQGSLTKARRELREYNRRVEEFNQRQRERRG